MTYCTQLPHNRHVHDVTNLVKMTAPAAVFATFKRPLLTYDKLDHKNCCCFYSIPLDRSWYLLHGIPFNEISGNIVGHSSNRYIFHH